MKYLGILLVVISSVSGLISCDSKNQEHKEGTFTKIDSLRENYLTLQDSVWQAWNIMVKDEGEKILAMHKLLHKLLAVDDEDKEKLIALEQRLEQLDRIRFTEKTMSDPHIVEEYDFASNSIISEIVSLAESNPTFPSDQHLQALADDIRSADQRVNMYRAEYDAVAAEYNQFLQENKEYLQEIDETGNTAAKPLFETE